jgi:hypothetical protein
MPLDFPTSPSLNQVYSFGGKSWKWNGEAWESYTFSTSAGTIAGTPNEVSVSESGGNYTIGLPSDVVVSNSIRAEYFNVNSGGTFSGGPTGITLSNTLGVSGDINILGKLVVDGIIVTKTGFSGYTLDGDIEPITDVDLDGGEF